MKTEAEKIAQIMADTLVINFVQQEPQIDNLLLAANKILSSLPSGDYRRVKCEADELTEKLTDILGSFYNKMQEAETEDQAAEEFAQTIVYIKSEFYIPFLGQQDEYDLSLKDPEY